MDHRAEGRSGWTLSLLGPQGFPHPWAELWGTMTSFPSRRPTRKMEFEVEGDETADLAVTVNGLPAAWMNFPKSLRLF